MKTLGLLWDVKLDDLQYNVTIEETSKNTKFRAVYDSPDIRPTWFTGTCGHRGKKHHAINVANKNRMG